MNGDFFFTTGTDLAETEHIFLRTVGTWAYRVVWVAATCLTVSCTALVDVEPDCAERNACGAYGCNEENTACLTSCASNRECAAGYICEVGAGQCLGGLCEAVGPVVSLESEEPFVEPVLVLSEDRARVPVIFRFGMTEEGMAADLLRASDLAPVDGHGLRLLDSPVSDSAPDYRLPMVFGSVSHRWLTMLWLSLGDNEGTMWSSYYDVEAEEWVDAAAVARFSSAGAPTVLSGVQVGSEAYLLWANAESSALYGVRWAIGAPAMGSPTKLDDAARLPVAVTWGDRVRAYWITYFGTGWDLRTREAGVGEDFLGDGDPVRAWGGVGAPPYRVQAAATSGGALVFMERRGGAGQTIRYLLRIVEGGSIGGERMWLQDFDEVEGVEVRQLPTGGAATLILGTWRGERGLWVVRISDGGVQSPVPLRVFDVEPREGVTFERYDLQIVGSSMLVSWVYGEGGGALPHQFNARLYRCGF